MNPSLSTFLNVSRWLAAFLVVIGHVRHMILVDYGSVAKKTIFQKALYFVTGLGHEAVIVFFVISGFLVGGLTLTKWESGGPHLRAYSSARISRIYTVLIPALIVGFALDFVGLHWLNSDELYTNPEQYGTNSLSPVASNGLDSTVFLGNLLMMQGTLTRTFGSNGPLWSLSYEWWYYCLFAFIAAAVTQTGKLKLRIGYVIAGSLLLVLLPQKIVLWGAIWALGIAANVWVNSNAWRPHPLIGFGCFFVVTAIVRLSHSTDSLANSSIIIPLAQDFATGAAFVVAIASATRMRALSCSKLHSWLADFSFTTYLFHFPAMLFLVAAGSQVVGLTFRVQPNGYGLVYTFSLTAILYVYCFAWSRVTEKYTNSIKRALDTVLSIRPSDAKCNDSVPLKAGKIISK